RRLPPTRGRTVAASDRGSAIVGVRHLQHHYLTNLQRRSPMSASYRALAPVDRLLATIDQQIQGVGVVLDYSARPTALEHRRTLHHSARLVTDTSADERKR